MQKRNGLAILSALAFLTVGTSNWGCGGGTNKPSGSTGGDSGEGGDSGSGGDTGTGGSGGTSGKGGSGGTSGSGGSGGDTGGSGGSSGSGGSGGSGGDTGGSGGSGGTGGDTGGSGGSGGTGGDTGGTGGSTADGGVDSGAAGTGGTGGSSGGPFTFKLLGMDETMAHAGGPVFTPAMSNTQNKSPAMMWSGEPAGTKSFAISMIDTQTPPSKTPPLKAGTSTKAHWVIYNIPATAHALPANLPNAAMLPDPMGALASATFSSKAGGGKSFGYFGPGGATSVYRVTLYALDVDKLPGINAGAAQMSTSDALRTGGSLASHVLGKIDYLAAGTNGGF